MAEEQTKPNYESFYKAAQIPTKQRSVVFETEKQRNVSYINKGITKPGRISYDVLRRAVNSVHIARICVNVLKERVTKTKWVIKSIDPLKEPDKKKIDTLTEIFKHPNKENETFRTLLDKMVEDLLVLDAVSLEKTRYDGGELAELHFVDSATIRPVFDEYGNQDIEIPLRTKHNEEKTLPVSYVQVLMASQYGGPESGEIVAAWAKKDFIHFHMHPQGAMESFGYGLSPLEGVLSVVANLLNADNYNGTYFETGSFPPIILQLAGNMNQRDLEAFREYFFAEMEGNFHRPAILAGVQDAKVLNLKELTNRDMQFMEYTRFLARLMAAAYGLSGQDIGLVDDLNRATSEVQKDLSEAKGYGSILNLFKEIFNQEVVWKDFGYTDLEFDWVVEDTTDPQKQMQIYDVALKNGTMTMNEVREKLGEQPYEEWANQPMILGASGYLPIVMQPEEPKVEEGADKIVGGEERYKDQETGDVTKSIRKDSFLRVLEGMIMSKYRKGITPEKIAEQMSEELGSWVSVESVWEIIDKYSHKDDVTKSSKTNEYSVPITFSYQSSGGGTRKQMFLNVKYAFNEEDAKQKAKNYVKQKYQSAKDFEFGEIITKHFQKSVYTKDGYRTFFDDRGYGQPFIFVDVLKGKGTVIKPPVAVNVMSQKLEEEITAQMFERGANVPVVKRRTFVDITQNVCPTKEVRIEFDKWINMTPEYDSEKWRNKFGGSRKYPYYLVQKFVDGYALNNNILIADMKRDPESYSLAIADLAKMWKDEKSLILGDRRADQYIISPDKRAWGVDYQFKGDVARWEDTKDAVNKLLEQVPQLHKMYNDLIADTDTKKSRLGKIKKIAKNLLRLATATRDNSQEFEKNPVLFGELFTDPMMQTEVKQLFVNQSTGLLIDNGFKELSFSYDFNQSSKNLNDFLKDKPMACGGIVKQQDERGIKYLVFVKE